jgi:chromosome segregation ATPase
MYSLLTQDKLNRSLQWVPDDKQVPVLERPKSKTSKPGNVVKDKAEQRALAANARLINALETEERRLRDNESKHIERIKTLTSELAVREDSHWKYVQVTKQFSEMKMNYTNTVTELKSLRADFDANKIQLKTTRDENVKLEGKCAEMTKQQNELSSQFEQIVQVKQKSDVELEQRAKDLQAANEQLSKLQESYTTLQATIANSETDVARQSLKFIKEREQLKTKHADVKRELSTYQDQLSTTRNDLYALQTKLSTRESEHAAEIRDSKLAAQKLIDDEVATQTASLKSQHQTQMADVHSQIDELRGAYTDLEHAYTHLRHSADGRIQDLETHLRGVSSTSESRAEEMKRMDSKEREQTVLIRDMIQLIKEQKSKIAQMAGKNLELLEESEEVRRVCEAKLGESKNECGAMRRVVEEQKQSIKSLGSRCKQLDGVEKENLTLTTKIAALETERLSHASQLATLDTRILELQNLTQDLKQEHKDQIAVKNAMLESQNESLRSVKHALELKVKAHTQTTQSLSELRAQLDEERGIDQETFDGLRRDVEELEAGVEYYMTLARDYKTQRDELREAVSECERKLRERNDAIERIESEVLGVDLGPEP